MPEVHSSDCGLGQHSKAAFWVGLGGTNGELEQIGALIQCNDGVLKYDALYEIIHQGSGTVIYIKDMCHTCVVNPYDYITAQVRHLGNGRYKLSIELFRNKR
jgi:Peptidase A4 family